jgi:hypothetical protein
VGRLTVEAGRVSGALVRLEIAASP